MQQEGSSSQQSSPTPNVSYEQIGPVELAKRWDVPQTWVREHVRKRTSDPIPHLKLGKYGASAGEARSWKHGWKRVW